MAISLIQKRMLWTRLLFRFNRHPISQAGRRGFDPRLPLLKLITYRRTKDVVLQNTPLRDLEGGFELIDRFPPPTQFWNRIHVFSLRQIAVMLDLSKDTVARVCKP
jgi:hypothetical protein